jgi:hypothetical protein
MALDLFAAPAMSSECERVFSRGGRVPQIMAERKPYTAITTLERS